MSWQDFLARHQVGDVIEGIVTKQVPFGSFVESEGFTGLAHKQGWAVGTHVRVKILAIDTESHSPGSALTGIISHRAWLSPRTPTP